MITGLMIGVASVSLFAACSSGAGAGSAPDPETAIVGTWGSSGKGQPNLVFDDGKVTGTDGCNGISSTYTVADGAITVARFMSTQMACTGVDTWLRGIHSVEIDGDALVVRNSAGDQIGTLDRNDG
ncbi:META domain-containing protein [Labedella gwakjiensis]|uniref:META domain-containing protein n=1 Tax=Labedella gwakjiensis TaxID=390269 RepID=UPI001408B808|nr:META domain-containing protein [Labedella gwakjiensis]